MTRPFITVLALVACILITTTPGKVRAESFEGTWNSRFGKLTLVERVMGHRRIVYGKYRDRLGIIFGYTDGRVLRGIFAHTDADRGHKLSEKKNNLGTFEWTLSVDGDSFDGHWRWGKTASIRSDDAWTGIRQSESRPSIHGRIQRAGAIHMFASGRDVPAWLAELEPEMWTRTRLGFDYEMRDRYGLDRNRNGIKDLPNTISYVENSGDGPEADIPPRCLELEANCIGATRFAVTLSLTGEAAKLAARGAKFEWEVRALSGAIPETVNADGSAPLVFLPEGRNRVSLQVRGRPETRHTRTLDVQDHFIAVLGDSFASGEGAPERTSPFNTSDEAFPSRIGAVWADTGEDYKRAGDNATPLEFPSRELVHNYRAHRSSFTHASQLAMQLEGMDTKSSVTFVNLAQSGATIAKGLLGRYSGIRKTEKADPIPGVPLPTCGVGSTRNAMCPQIYTLQRLARTRTIDKLYLSVGGNDVGFAYVITALMIAHRSDILGAWENALRNLSPNPDTIWAEDVSKDAGEFVLSTTLGKMKRAFQDGDWPKHLSQWENLFESMAFPDAQVQKVAGMDGLPNAYSDLDERFDTMIARGQLRDAVTIIAPPFFGTRRFNDYPRHEVVKSRATGNLYCLARLHDDVAGAEFHPIEMAWTEPNIYRPMVAAIKDAAQTHGWSVIETDRDIIRHGLCAKPIPGSYNAKFRHPITIDRGSQFRWYNSPQDGEAQQTGHDSSNTGMFHPNPRGFAYTRELMVNALRDRGARQIHGFRDLFEIDRNDSIASAFDVSSRPNSTVPMSLTADWDVGFLRVRPQPGQRLKINVRPNTASAAGASSGCIAISVFDRHGNLVATNSDRLYREVFRIGPQPPLAEIDELACDPLRAQGQGVTAGMTNFASSLALDTRGHSACQADKNGGCPFYIALSRPSNVFFDPVTGRGDVDSQFAFEPVDADVTISILQ